MTDLETEGRARIAAFLEADRVLTRMRAACGTALIPAHLRDQLERAEDVWLAARAALAAFVAGGHRLN